MSALQETFDRIQEVSAQMRRERVREALSAHRGQHFYGRFLSDPCGKSCAADCPARVTA